MAGSSLRQPLTRENIIGIILSGAFEGREKEQILRCDDLEEKVTELLLRERQRRFIGDNYHFVTAGAFPYSEEVHRTIEFFHEVGILTYIMGEEGENIYPKVVRFAEVSRKQRRISRADYEFLRNLGKKLVHR